MGRVVFVALAGFVASFVDGVLGMGFGPTSSTILLGAGLAPAAVSTTVNVAKVASGTAGGIAHWRFGNIDRRLVLQLAAPGCVGAVLGVTVLANVDGDRIRPYLAVLLLAVGLRILLRFSKPAAPRPPEGATTGGFSRRGIGPAAFAGGVTNGLIGAWGPVVTPVLLSKEGLEPRVAIGSVNTAEVAVAVAASGSLIASLGGTGVPASTLAAMLIGGAIAAPVAAWAVHRLAPRALGIGAGALLLVTNVRELAGWADVGAARWVAYAVVAAGCVAASRRGRPAKFEPAATHSVAPGTNFGYAAIDSMNESM